MHIPVWAGQFLFSQSASKPADLANGSCCFILISFSSFLSFWAVLVGFDF